LGFLQCSECASLLVVLIDRREGLVGDSALGFSAMPGLREGEAVDLGDCRVSSGAGMLRCGDKVHSISIDGWHLIHWTPLLWDLRGQLAGMFLSLGAQP